MPKKVVSQVVRQWQILRTLETQSATLQQLAFEFNVNPRTIRRDLECLQEAQFPILQRAAGRSDGSVASPPQEGRRACEEGRMTPTKAAVPPTALSLLDDINRDLSQATALTTMMSRIFENTDKLDDELNVICFGFAHVAEHVKDLQENTAKHVRALYEIAKATQAGAR